MAESSRHPQSPTDSSQRYQPTNKNGVDVYELLANTRRRHIIDIVDTHGELDISELARRIAAREHDKPRDDLTSDEYKAAYVGVYQVHIPRLDAADGLEWDEDKNTITATALTRQFRDVIDAVESTLVEDGVIAPAGQGTIGSIVKWVTGQ